MVRRTASLCAAMAAVLFAASPALAVTLITVTGVSSGVTRTATIQLTVR